jgi:hypothetical protein
VAYRLDLPDGLNEEPLQLLLNLSYVEKPKEILERSVKELRNKKTFDGQGFVGTSWSSRYYLGNRGMDEEKISGIILRYDIKQFRGGNSFKLERL